jgi:DNA topoisomerase-1
VNRANATSPTAAHDRRASPRGIRKRKSKKAVSTVQSAFDAGLSHVSDRDPGIRRVSGRNGFQYFNSNGKAVRSPATLPRIKSLVIPPNWKDVWICIDPKGHLQATGRDARNRKQYRYHPRYRAVREQTKFEKMVPFGRMLPRIRNKVNQDFALPGLPKEKVLAAVVRLMDLAHIRVGNEEYARENQSFGLTTMRDRHVEIEGSKIHFKFRGKSGKAHALDIQDRRLAGVVKQCRDLPGYELFQYVDERGDHKSVDSGMVNQYLRESTGHDITAKDFRTWHGTVHAAEQLGVCGAARTESEAKRNIVIAIQAVAERLGNRPGTCRKYYVHPMVVELYFGNNLDQYMTVKPGGHTQRGLDPSEQCVLQLLQKLERPAKTG